MDFVIGLDGPTYKDHPSWPGQPEVALWEYPTLEAGKGSGLDVGIATMQTLHSLRRRIELLVSLHSKVSKRSDLTDDLRNMAFQ
jgi:hypothetical protein